MIIIGIKLKSFTRWHHMKGMIFHFECYLSISFNQLWLMVSEVWKYLVNYYVVCKVKRSIGRPLLDIMACYAKSMIKMMFNRVFFAVSCITGIIQDVIQQEPTWQTQKSTQLNTKLNDWTACTHVSNRKDMKLIIEN